MTIKGHIMVHSEMDNFSDRLRKQREKLGIRKHELAASIGVSLTTIQQYESGQMPRGEFAVRLAKELNCSLDWLLAGRNHEQRNLKSTEQSLVQVPIVEASVDPNDNGLRLSNKVEGYFAFYGDFLHAKGNPLTMVLLRIMGDSMLPHIVNNDMVLIDQAQTKLMPGQMYAIGVEHMVYIKRVDVVPGKLLFSSVNPNYDTIELDIKNQNTVCILGRVLWLGRDLS